MRKKAVLCITFFLIFLYVCSSVPASTADEKQWRKMSYEKNLKDCGKCTEVPCSIWRATRDPKYSDEEFEKSISMRIQALNEKLL